MEIKFLLARLLMLPFFFLLLLSSTKNPLVGATDSQVKAPEAEYVESELAHYAKEFTFRQLLELNNFHQFNKLPEEEELKTRASSGRATPSSGRAKSTLSLTGLVITTSTTSGSGGGRKLASEQMDEFVEELVALLFNTVRLVKLGMEKSILNEATMAGIEELVCTPAGDSFAERVRKIFKKKKVVKAQTTAASSTLTVPTTTTTQDSVTEILQKAGRSADLLFTEIANELKNELKGTGDEQRRANFHACVIACDMTLKQLALRYEQWRSEEEVAAAAVGSEAEKKCDHLRQLFRCVLDLRYNVIATELGIFLKPGGMGSDDANTSGVHEKYGEAKLPNSLLSQRRMSEGKRAILMGDEGGNMDERNNLKALARWLSDESTATEASRQQVAGSSPLAQCSLSGAGLKPPDGQMFGDALVVENVVRNDPDIYAPAWEARMGKLLLPLHGWKAALKKSQYLHLYLALRARSTIFSSDNGGKATTTEEDYGSFDAMLAYLHRLQEEMGPSWRRVPGQPHTEAKQALFVY